MKPLALFLAAIVAAPQDPTPAVPNWSAPPFWTPPAAAALASGDPEADGSAGPHAIPTAPLVLVGIAPCRIVDTRGTAGVPYNTGGKLAAGESRSYDLNSAPAPCNGIPAGTEAFSINLTATEPEGPGFLSGYPSGPVPNPLTSLLNYATGENVANATVVPSDANGSVTILTSTAVHVIVDVNGYYAPLSSQTGAVVTSLAGGTGALALGGTNGITVARIGQAITVTSNATPSNTSGSLVLRDAFGGFAAGAIELAGSPSLLTTGGGTRLLHRTGDPTNLFLGPGAGGTAATGGSNSAFGSNALPAVSSGYFNTAFGMSTLASLTTACCNSAFGGGALFANVGGTANSAFGVNALNLSTGSNNAAFGGNALVLLTGGDSNTAIGTYALDHLASGGSNTAVGTGALGPLTSGSDNVAVGHNAGNTLTSGSGNIYVGKDVAAGSASESNTIRIGLSTHTSTFLGGISGQTSASGVAVLVNSSGKLGTTTSSRRYKTDIEDVGSRSDVLSRLRPVTFLYREDLDPDRVRQYGLVAEEVAEVAPDLVVTGEDGRPQTVRYHLLVPLLLDALQKQERRIDELSRQLEALRRASRDDG